MDPPLPCRQCGAPLTNEAREGLCPRCLFLGLPIEEAEPDLDVLAPPEGPALRRFGEYDLLEEVGRGGMGVVYKAWQRSLHRLVALKMLAPGVEASSEFIRRLRSEATAAAGLHHPNIVAIHEVGVWEKQHYFAMDFIAGPSLAKLGGHQPLPARKAAVYLQQIAEAVHHAHEQGILHRDLKPSNILIDAEDRPLVSDFGLARRLEGDSQVTLTGQVLGSPPYMPPEQIQGRGGKLSRRTDVYALGAMLYQMLTGRPPFGAAELTQLIHQVLQTDPVPPRVISPSIPRDLETMCLKCLEKEPAKRYSTAEELAEELKRFLEGRPILARPVGVPGKCWRWCRRNPRLAVVTMGLALTLLVLFAEAIWSWRRDREQLAHQRILTYASDTRAAQIALEQGNRGQALDLLRRHTPHPGAADLRGIEWRYLWQKAQSDQIKALDQEAIVSGLSLSPDGTVVATGLNGQTRIWSGHTGKLASELTGPPLPLMVHQANAVAPGLALLARPMTNGAGVQRLPDLGMVTVLPGASWPLEFSHDGRWLVTCGPSYQLLLWEVGRWEPRPIATYSRSLSPYLTLRFSFDDQELLWCGRTSSTIHIHRLSSGGTDRQLPGLEMMTSLATSSDGRWIAVGSWTGQARIFEYATGVVVTNWSPHSGLVFGLAFSPDNAVLATGGNDQVVRLWDAGSWRLVATLSGNESEIWDLVFAPDGQTLWTAAKDGTVRQFPVHAPRRSERRFFVGTNCLVRALSASGDRALVSESTDMFAISELDTLTLASRPLVAVPRQDVLRATQWPQAHLIQLTNGHAILVRAGRKPAVLRLQLPSPTARLLAESWNERTLLVQDANRDQVEGRLFTWDCGSGRVESDLGVTPAWNTAAFSPDGQSVACVSDRSAEAVIWDIDQRRQRAILRGHRWNLYCASFSPDGRLVATGSWDGTARLWHPATGRCVAVLRGHRSGVHLVQFSEDGRTLITVGDDAALGFWNVATGQEMLHLNEAYASIGHYVEFAPRISSDNRALLFGPFLSALGEGDASTPRWRYVVTTIPTPAEVDAARR